jgi:hypothetical protein
LEASHDHLLVTPPSHLRLQKVRGFVDGLTGLREDTNYPKLLPWDEVVKAKNSGKIDGPKMTYFVPLYALDQNPRNDSYIQTGNHYQ